MTKAARVSVHGGHSGQFCHHATDTLEEIVEAYIKEDFSWVGITEHTPAINEALLYPDEKEAGLTSELLYNTFSDYLIECRRLQKKYRQKIGIYVGMEIETYSGYEHFVPALLQRFRPDYIVGSVHFVDDVPFDYSREEYERAKEKSGGIVPLYCRYFDQQYAMLDLLKPAVVGHFDLIRIYDDEYSARLQHPEIVSRIERNLQLIKHYSLILDYNLRAILKGASEPYVSRSILNKALELGIAVVPGDDSHGVASVGKHIDEAMTELVNMGFDSHWQKPKQY